MTNISEPENTGQQASEGSTAMRAASRSGRVLAYWRWGKIRELLEAAGQLALFDRADVPMSDDTDLDRGGEDDRAPLP